MTELLRVKNPVTQFKTESSFVKAVDDITYFIDDKEIIGPVGESGYGKLVCQLSTM